MRNLGYNLSLTISTRRTLRHTSLLVLLHTSSPVINHYSVNLNTRRKNSRKNYRACPHNKGAKNISIDVCRLRKENYSAFLFLKEVYEFFREREREREHEKIS